MLKSEWEELTADMSPLKIGEVKFLQCPVSVVTEQTWQILSIINKTTDEDCKIILPYSGTSYLEQPRWYLQAIDIVRAARSKNREIQRSKRG